MKVKSLIAVAVAGLFATSISFADPMSSSDDGMQPQQLADNGSVGSSDIGGGLDQSATGMGDASSGAGNTSASNNVGTSMIPDAGAGTGDDMSADTATGDDDF